jgi:UDP-N-acetylmuramate dehydrogenase
MNMLEKLQQLTGVKVLADEPLRNYTSFKIGGPAKFFVKAENKDELKKCLESAVELKLNHVILGGGSNVLVSDNGFDGLVIKLTDGALDFSGNKIKAFAGHSLALLIREAINKNLGGLEFAANIPGTVGGGIYGNAGAYGKGVGDLAETVGILEIVNGSVVEKTLTQKECEFKYRDSIFKKHSEWIISEIVFNLIADENAKAKLDEIQKEWEARKAKQPWNVPSAGSTFKNLIYTEDLAKFKEWETKGKIAAGKFIEEAGLKGMKIGGAQVSDLHANFIINTGDATAQDVLQLISLVKMKVRDEFNVQLEDEVQYVGF